MRKLAIVLALFLMGCKSNMITLDGVISIKGSSPHSFVAITANNRVYQIVNAKELNLSRLQNQRVRVEAKLVKDFKSIRRVKAIEVIKVIK